MPSPRVTGRVEEISFVRVSLVPGERLIFRLQNKIQENLCLRELAVFAAKRFIFILSHYMIMHQFLKIFWIEFKEQDCGLNECWRWGCVTQQLQNGIFECWRQIFMEESANVYTHTHTHTYIYMFMCVYTYVCACVCVYHDCRNNISELLEPNTTVVRCCVLLSI